MARVTKHPDERKNEILDTAQKLFNTKGYENTSINEIVNEIGIAKGTLYYYFKTKEEMYDSIIERFCENLIDIAKKIVNEKELNAIEKIKAILYEKYNLDKNNNEMLKYSHSQIDFQMTQKTSIYLLKSYSPIIAEIVIQGNVEGMFQVEYPLETVQFIIAGYRMLLGLNGRVWTINELMRMSQVIQNIVESSLNAPKDSFLFLRDIIANYNQLDQV